MERKIAEQEIVTCCRKLYNRQFVSAYDGNVSVLLDGETLLITPTTVNKGALTPDKLITLDMKGCQVEGGLSPSSEAPLHIACYANREDIRAVIHAHPPYATALASTEHADLMEEEILLPELLLTAGKLGVIPYFSPGSSELAQHSGEVMAARNGALLKNHGVLTVGRNIDEAYFRLENIEHYCKIWLLANSMGKSCFLSKDEVEKLLGRK